MDCNNAHQRRFIAANLSPKLREDQKMAARDPGFWDGSRLGFDGKSPFTFFRKNRFISYNDRIFYFLLEKSK